MPDPFTPTPNEIENLRRTCVQQAREAIRARDLRDRRQREFEESRADDDAPSLTATHVVYVLAALAVIGIDILLLAPTAEYVVGGAFPNNPSLANAAKFILPFCVVLLELAMAMRIYEARGNLQTSQHDVNGKAESNYRTWWWLGVSFVVFMPLLALSSQLAELGSLMTTSDSLNWYTELSLLGKTLALAILAFVAHALFIFGGRYIIESKEALFNYFANSPVDRLQNAQERFEQLRDGVLDTFADYYRALTGYNENHDQQISAGPFPEQVRRLINNGYGRDILETPPRSSTHGRIGGDGVAGPVGGPPTPGSDGSDRFSGTESNVPNPGIGGEGEGEGGRPAAAPDEHDLSDVGGSAPNRGGVDEDPGSDYRDLYDQQRRDDADGALLP